MKTVSVYWFMQKNVPPAVKAAFFKKVQEQCGDVKRDTLVDPEDLTTILKQALDEHHDRKTQTG